MEGEALDAIIEASHKYIAKNYMLKNNHYKQTFCQIIQYSNVISGKKRKENEIMGYKVRGY